MVLVALHHGYCTIHSVSHPITHIFSRKSSHKPVIHYLASTKVLTDKISYSLVEVITYLMSQRLFGEMEETKNRAKSGDSSGVEKRNSKLMLMLLCSIHTHNIWLSVLLWMWPSWDEVITEGSSHLTYCYYCSFNFKIKCSFKHIQKKT